MGLRVKRVSRFQVKWRRSYETDPNHFVDIDKFTEIICRHIEQPKEGLGFDNSPSAHMWRTISTPDAPL